MLTGHEKYLKCLSGWRAGVLLSCLTGLAVLLVNVTVIIWTLVKHNPVDGTGTLFKGDCDKTKSLNTKLQLGINILCTLLFGASNYCMQYLTSPTRQEIDAAHSRKSLLRVGVQSFRNLKAISWERVVLWLALGFSLCPLHFFYNAAVFTTIQANAYTVLSGPEDILESSFNESAFYLAQGGDSTSLVAIQELRARIKTTRDFEELDLHSCVEAYAQQYTSKWGDVLLIENSTRLLFPSRSSPSFSNSQIYTSQVYNEASPDWGFWNHLVSAWTQIESGTADPQPPEGAIILSIENATSEWNATTSNWESRKSSPPARIPLYNLGRPYDYQSSPIIYPSFNWRCPVPTSTNCTAVVKNMISNGTPWSPFGGQVLYCCAQRTPEQCTLNFSVHLAYVVVSFNIVKVVCMFLILWRHREPALVTLGDAIKSFLNRPDITTSGLCLHSAASLYGKWQGKGSEITLQWRAVKQEQVERSRFKRHVIRTRYWYHSVTVLRWLGCLILASVVLLGGWQSLPLVGIGSSASGPLTFSMQPLAGRYVITTQLPLFAAALVANTPQVILSYFYMAFNSLLTCMVSGHEWLQYAKNRRPLRVSSPEGQQKSTYYLQLPYIYSLPLLGISTLLSWLASQSLYMVRIAVRSPGTRFMDDTLISTCAYSPGAILITLTVAMIYVISVASMGLRKYPTGMPLSATCSGAISAACHPPSDDVDAALLPVQWGVVSSEDGLGHCSFSSKKVGPLIEGATYA